MTHGPTPALPKGEGDSKHPAVRKIVVLGAGYLPAAGYFRAMAEADLAVIDTAMRYDKRRKAVHRTIVSGADGKPSLLTVPVSTPGTSRCRWDEVRVSPHGEWWRVQRMTLATLFGPTPWFDLMRHDIFPAIDERAVGRTITDLDIDLILAIRRLAGITTPLSVALDPRYVDDPDVTITDLRDHDFFADPEARSAIETLFKEGSL